MPIPRTLARCAIAAAALGVLLLAAGCGAAEPRTPVNPVSSDDAPTPRATPSTRPVTKPTQDEVLRGMAKVVGASAAPQAGRYYRCVVHDLYNKLSNEQLREIADGRIPPEVTPHLRKAVERCMRIAKAKT